MWQTATMVLCLVMLCLTSNLNANLHAASKADQAEVHVEEEAEE